MIMNGSSGIFSEVSFVCENPSSLLIVKNKEVYLLCICFCLLGQPKRHLLTTGWSVFVSAKRLVAGDSVLFIWLETFLQCWVFFFLF